MPKAEGAACGSRSLHDEVGDGAALDVQRRAGAKCTCRRSRAPGELGHEAVVLSCGMDLAKVRDALVRARPDLVFNLVGVDGGYGAMIQVILSPGGAPIQYAGRVDGGSWRHLHKVVAASASFGRTQNRTVDQRLDAVTAVEGGDHLDSLSDDVE